MGPHSSPEGSPLVTVIVPVWNGAETIGGCLDALSAQTLAASRIQIIVVDNGSTDDTAAVVARYPSVEFLREPRSGSYIARNLGLRAAKGAYIAFTDADCRPAADWLACGLATVKQPGVGIVAGDIRIEGDAPALVLAYENTFAFRQRANVAKGQCATANWLSPADVIHQHGGFDPSAKSGGDWKLSRAIRSSGLALVFEPKMVVYHPPRASFAEIEIKRRRVAGGRWQTQDAARGLVPALRTELADCIRKVAIALGERDLAIFTRLKLVPLVISLSMASMAEILKLNAGGAPSRA